MVLLSGWNRLGIVLPVFFGLAANGATYIPLPMIPLLSIHSGKRLLCVGSANNARFDQCVQDTIGQYKWEAKQSYEKVLAGGIVAFVFTWLVIALYRWVRRGFVKELER